MVAGLRLNSIARVAVYGSRNLAAPVVPLFLFVD